jgi:hypothetical protein
MKCKTEINYFYMNKENFITRATLTGRVPSKKNSRNIFVKYGKLFNLPSKSYKDWHIDASKQLKTSVLDGLYERNDMFIVLQFYSPDKRKYDLTNKAESIMDLLVDNKVLEDDNYTVGKDILLSYKGVEKGGKVDILFFKKLDIEL